MFLCTFASCFDLTTHPSSSRSAEAAAIAADWRDKVLQNRLLDVLDEPGDDAVPAPAKTSGAKDSEVIDLLQQQEEEDDEVVYVGRKRPRRLPKKRERAAGGAAVAQCHPSAP